LWFVLAVKTVAACGTLTPLRPGVFPVKLVITGADTQQLDGTGFLSITTPLPQPAIVPVFSSRALCTLAAAFANIGLWEALGTAHRPLGTGH